MPRVNYPIQVQRKVAIIGFRAVGKTVLATRFVEDQFLERYDPTIENTYRKTIQFRRVHFFTDIVDTAGMDEYSRLSRNALVGVHGYVLVYSITSRISFEKIKSINDTLLHMLGDSPIPRVLVGSMLDLAEQRQVSPREGQILAHQLGDIPFIECSAKKDNNIAEIFHLLMKEVEKDNGYIDKKDIYAPGACGIS